MMIAPTHCTDSVMLHFDGCFVKYSMHFNCYDSLVCILTVLYSCYWQMMLNLTVDSLITECISIVINNFVTTVKVFQLLSGKCCKL
jgi:hypothetical protein